MVPDAIVIRRGVTLIEVVVSLMLCVLLFSLILPAFSAHRRQLERAARIRAATRGMDSLLASWHQSTDPVPRKGDGVLDEEMELSWKLQPVATEDSLRAMGVQKCQLVATFGAEEICEVEFLVEIPKDTLRPTAEGVVIE